MMFSAIDDNALNKEKTKTPFALTPHRRIKLE